MKSGAIEPTILIPLPATFIAALLKIREALDNDVVSTLETGLASGAFPVIGSASEEMPIPPRPPSQKYTTEFLGKTVTTRTLPEVFAKIVDMTDDVAPEVLESLSKVSSRTRRFVARNPERIHPGSPHLPVMRTDSGWWISKNIGQEDLKRALRALCSAAGLRFGKDVKFFAA